MYTNSMKRIFHRAKKYGLKIVESTKPMKILRPFDRKKTKIPYGESKQRQEYQEKKLDFLQKEYKKNGLKYKQRHPHFKNDAIHHR
jgi:uncharacterized protein (DUF302 family)